MAAFPHVMRTLAECTSHICTAWELPACQVSHDHLHWHCTGTALAPHGRCMCDACAPDGRRMGAA
eukprot:362607-Chlamydomonas_euryale.AAC.6